MPQLDPSSYPSQLFWLVITFVTLFFILSRMVVPKIGGVKQSRQQKIDKDVEKAETLRVKAASIQEDYENTLAKAAQAARDAHQAAADEIAAKAEKEHGELAAKMAEQTRLANERISASKDTAVGEMKAASVEVVQAATERLIGSKVDAGDAKSAIDAIGKEMR